MTAPKNIGTPAGSPVKGSIGASVKKIGLIAGEGSLPLHVVRDAQARGIEVVAFNMFSGNRAELKKLCGGAAHKITPGLLRQNLALLQQNGITDIVFAGKVNKWLLFRDPRLDEMAIGFLRQATRLNDDSIMLWIIRQLEEQGLRIHPQTAFLQSLFRAPGVLADYQPTERDLQDIEYGFEIAKEMGRLDVGQSIVVKNGMLLSVEAIEGTDECLKRAGQWARKKGGVVIKVAKPDQDQRFDVPTVGLRTLKTMKRAGLHLLATEANETLFLEPEEMIAFANRHGIGIVSCPADNPAAVR